MTPVNNVEFHRNNTVPGIEACRVLQSSHRFPKHSHEEFYAVSMMISGASSWDGRISENSLVEPGCIAVIPAGQVHTGIPVDNAVPSYKMLYISKDLFSETCRDIMEKNDVTPEIEKNVSRDFRLLSLFSSVYNSVVSDSDVLELDSCFSDLIAG